MEPREWVPDVAMIADQLIADYRNQTWEVDGLGVTGHVSEGEDGSIATIVSWLRTARDHGGEFQQDDWIALVQELARRAARGQVPE